MTIPEWIAEGNCKCSCENLKLSAHKKMWTDKIGRGSDSIKRLINGVLGNVRYSNHSRWLACCSQCGKFYFATTSKKDMKSSLVIAGLPY